MITVINNRLAFKDRNFSSVVNDILFFSSLQSWKAFKVSRCVNFKTNWFAKWVDSNLVFVSILKRSHILSSIQIKSENDPLLQHFPAFD
jgi:hypothetical protein